MLKGLASTESSLPALEDLKLGNNAIVSVEELAFLPRLLYLDLSHNNVSELVPLQASRSNLALYLNMTKMLIEMLLIEVFGCLS